MIDNKLSKPVAGEVKGILCHSEEEARSYVGEPEPLYSQEYVSALLAELEAKDKRIAELEFEQNGYGYSVLEDLNGKIKRIAGLEAKLATPVRLPTAMFCPEEYVGSLLWSETEAHNKAISKCAEALRTAGFTVEGAE